MQNPYCTIFLVSFLIFTYEHKYVHMFVELFIFMRILLYNSFSAYFFITNIHTTWLQTYIKKVKMAILLLSVTFCIQFAVN